SRPRRAPSPPRRRRLRSRPRRAETEPMEQRYIGEILVRRGVLSAEKAEEMLATAQDKGVGLMAVLLATRAVDEPVLVKALADEIGMEFVAKVDPAAVPEDLIETVPIN